jgi:Glutaminase
MNINNALLTFVLILGSHWSPLFAKTPESLRNYKINDYRYTFNESYSGVPQGEINTADKLIRTHPILISKLNHWETNFLPDARKDKLLSLIPWFTASYCEVRATYAAAGLAAYGFTPPQLISVYPKPGKNKKLIAPYPTVAESSGNRYNYIENAPWDYHVAIFYPAEDGEFMVLDPAISNDGPMTARNWLDKISAAPDDFEINLLWPHAARDGRPRLNRGIFDTFGSSIGSFFSDSSYFGGELSHIAGVIYFLKYLHNYDRVEFEKTDNLGNRIWDDFFIVNEFDLTFSGPFDSRNGYITTFDDFEGRSPKFRLDENNIPDEVADEIIVASIASGYLNCKSLDECKARYVPKRD